MGKVTESRNCTYFGCYGVHTYALVAMKLKLELANAERERLKEQAAFEKETLQRKEREATLEREREKEALQLLKELAALQREQVEFQRERERKQLELKEHDLEIQREHDKKQAASALDHRRAAVTLSTIASETDYQELKQAVLDAYLLSTETYRRKFGDYLKESTTTYRYNTEAPLLHYLQECEATEALHIKLNIIQKTAAALDANSTVTTRIRKTVEEWDSLRSILHLHPPPR
ncbi:cilia- and flagella- associated protein 210-like [Procambarus clarkii]|uniref:cilia- and flagella- associated protein 210-like n=1 Tax=Procambarus clarkii TaxID=6728 RepID=UPI0037420AEC